VPSSESETPPIRNCDLTLSASGARVFIGSSKNDPYRKGAVLRFFPTGTITCPVRALREMLRGSAFERKPTASLFELTPGVHVRRAQVVKTIKQCVSWLGLDKEAFSGHSLRRGGATSYALAGVSDATIRTMGRWRSFSYQHYIEAPDSAISRAMQSMSAAEVKVFGGRSLEDIISISLDNLAIPMPSSRAVEVRAR